MPWVCAACGSIVENDFNYCRECGEFIEPIWEPDDEDEDEGEEK